jgi:uncharacterized membrane protein YbhN (UPF0104 family)
MSTPASTSALPGAAGNRAEPPADKDTKPKRGLTSRPWWPWLRRALTLLFFGGVGYLLYTHARTIDWAEVANAMRRQSGLVLLLAAALAAASHLLISCFDLLGRHVTGHTLATRTVMTVNFISYAFNLNLGSLVGGVAFRFRLYNKLGLGNDVITRVMTVSMFTNWLGYLLLAGIAFAFWPMQPPDEWKISLTALHVLGGVLFAVALLYLGLCAFSKRRSWTVRGHELSLPDVRFAGLQLLMSSSNWLLMAAVVYVLLGREIEFTVVLGVLLVAAIAGVITHVPAGLGVLEAVFVTLLSHRMPATELLAALLAYRALYYIVPLGVATVVYAVMEARSKKAKG